MLRHGSNAALLALYLATFAAPVVAADAADPDLTARVEQGRRIYMEGVLPSGKPLLAVRPGGVTLSGKQAACVACHRKSGLGAVEGDIQVPPITGQALRAGTKLKDRVIVSLDPRRGRSWNQAHAPYTDETLLRAMREGVHVSGRKMSPLMPIYPMTAEQLKVLDTFLQQLSADWSPGVTGDTIRFATVIAPGIDPARVKSFRDTLQAALEQKNSNTIPGHRHMINAAEMVLHVERRWILDVWELSGAPETWDAQLAARYQQTPVFALVSGLSDTVWDPVQRFCERQSMPCWFPTVPAPPADADEQYYGLYYTRGVEAEAAAIASRFSGRPGPRPQRIVQVLRETPAARAAAQALRALLPRALRVGEVVLNGEGAAPLAAALAGIGRNEAAVLWLGPEDFRLLDQLAPPQGAVYASTRLSQSLDPVVPAAWRSQLHLAYPYDLPPMRDLNMATFRTWLKVRSLPVTDEPMQLEVYFSMSYLQFTLSEMLDNVYRDYLIDRGESMLVRRELQRAEEETMIRQGGHPPARAVREASTLAPGALYGDDPQGMFAQKNTPAIGLRQGTTMYPRLSLAQGQRFASKGAYIAHYGPNGVLVAESDWIIR